jgi:transcriptional antiterminator NusG
MLPDEMPTTESQPTPEAQTAPAEHAEVVDESNNGADGAVSDAAASPAPEEPAEPEETLAPEAVVAEPPKPPQAPPEASEPGPEDQEPAKEKPAAPSNKRWYVVKVQSGREESIKEAIERRVKIEGLEEFFGQIIIPIERVTEMRNGKRVTRSRKLYPGYLMVEVEFNDRILYLFRETSGWAISWAGG